MRNIKPVVLILLLLVGLALTGCSDSPPSGLVEEAILKKVGRVKEMKNIDILNKYSKEVDGEDIWTIEFEAEVVYTDSTARTIGRAEDKFKDKVRMVHRGNTWYKL